MPDSMQSNHRQAILSGLSEALEQLENCDLQVDTVDGRLMVPSLIMASVCPTFKSHIVSGGLQPADCCIQLPGLTSAQLQIFLQCLLYSGEEQILSSDVSLALIHVSNVLGCDIVRGGVLNCDNLHGGYIREIIPNLNSNKTGKVKGTVNVKSEERAVCPPSFGQIPTISTNCEPDSKSDEIQCQPHQVVNNYEATTALVPVPSKCLFTLANVDLEKVTDEVLTENFSDQLGRLVCLVCYKILGPSDFPTYRSHVGNHDRKQLEKITMILPDIGRGGPGLKKKSVSDIDLDTLYKDETGRYLQCPKCDRKTEVTEKAIFRKHLTYHNHKEKNYLYQCPKCPNIFTDPSNLKRHVQSVHEKQVFRCLHCDFEDSRKRRLEDHLINAHGDKVGGDEEICLDKGEGAEAIADLTANEPTLPNFGSTESDNRSTEEGDELINYRRLSPSNVQQRFSYQCTGCKFRKRKLSIVESHLKEAHSGTSGVQVRKIALKSRKVEQLNLSCKTCPNLTFKKRTLLNQHNLRIHNLQVETTEFACSQCGVRCANLPGLKAHERGHQAKIFLCGSCSKSFLGLNQLRDHVNKGVCLLENRQCGICKKIFSDKVRLDLHMRTHTNVKPFPCHICEKSFTQKRSLKEHLLTHDTVRHFECSHCQKKFVQKNHLKYHLASNHGETTDNSGTKNECQECGKVFPFPYQLRKHSSVHSRGQVAAQSKLQCGNCATWFTSPALLQVHSQTCSEQVQLSVSHVDGIIWEPHHEVIVVPGGSKSEEMVTDDTTYKLAVEQSGSNQYQLVNVNNLVNYTIEKDAGTGDLAMDII